MRYSVLVVDDEAYVRQVLEMKLRRAGYAVHVASDGEEGLRVAREERPDLVITDLHMPYVDGLAMCRCLLEDAQLATVPVLLLTARGYQIDRRDAVLDNVRDVHLKPFSPSQILKQVDEILGEIPGARAA